MFYNIHGGGTGALRDIRITLYYTYTPKATKAGQKVASLAKHIFNIRPDIFMLLLKFQCSSTLIHLRTPLKMMIILVKGKSRKANSQGQGWEGIHLMRDPLCRYSYCATFDYIKTRMVLVKKRREGEIFADTYSCPMDMITCDILN